MAEVFLCKKGQLNSVGKHDLRQAGVVVVEVDDLTACQFIKSTELVSGDDMLWAAMDALKHSWNYGNEGNKQREQFALNIAKLVEATRENDG